jgi:hypothetical protein
MKSNESFKISNPAHWEQAIGGGGSGGISEDEEEEAREGRGEDEEERGAFELGGVKILCNCKEYSYPLLWIN